MDSPRVRIANSRDVNDLIDLVREAIHEECSLPLKFSSANVFDAIIQAMQGEGVIGVIGEPGEIQSSCFLRVARVWYSGEDILEALWFFTRPDYRKSNNSKVLLTWARSQADKLHAPLQLEVSVNEPSRPKFALCERVLGAPCGFGFVYTPQPDNPTELGEAVVEPASLANEAEVIEVARELSQENGCYGVDESLAIPMIRAALNGHGVIGIIRGPDSKIQGTAFLKISSPWWSTEPFLDEHWVHVPAQFRKSSNAKALLQWAKRQADKLDLSLRVGIISKPQLARKQQLYQRILGHEPSSAHFSYRLETA